MIELPHDISDALQLADWLELQALVANDQNSSINDLVTPLRIASGNTPPDETRMAVFSELEQRVRMADRAYPFRLSRGVLQTKPNRRRYAAYLFCLGLSHFGWKQTKNAPINPWFLFEDLACIAAKQYLGGDVLLFGSRSLGNARSFKSAIDKLCLQLGEGEGFRGQRTFSQKDDKVDLVAWRHFSDQKPSKIVMFGQCAAGGNWKEKTRELQPRAFWDNWLAQAPVSQLVRSFYIPHRIPMDQWDQYARNAGVLFDRCRVAYWAYRDNAAVVANHSYYLWFTEILKENSRKSGGIRQRATLAKPKKHRAVHRGQ